MNGNLKQIPTIRQIARLQSEQRYSEAEALCRETLANSTSLPEQVSWQNCLATIKEAQGRYDEALTYARTALSSLEAAKEQLPNSTPISLELATLTNLTYERILRHYAQAEKTGQEMLEVQLTEAQLEVCAAGARASNGCPTWSCGGNHNETMVNTQLTLGNLTIN